MNGSITLVKTYENNQQGFILIGYYDTWREQEQAIINLVKLLVKGHIDNVEVKTYNRMDNYKATYITIK